MRRKDEIHETAFEGNRIKSLQIKIIKSLTFGNQILKKFGGLPKEWIFF
jgi:hypothetical protein